MNKKSLIIQSIKSNIETKKKILKDKGILAEIEKIADEIVKAFNNDKKVLLCGNGGSAADAQHIAGEMVNRFKIDRNPLPAISLVTDTSVLTSIANDSGYDYVFSKQIEALGKRGDIAIAITTSDIELKKGGHSANIAQALLAAKKKGMIRIGFLSEKSKEVLELVDLAIQVPSNDTPRIQESHILIAHIICEIVEKRIFGK